MEEGLAPFTVLGGARVMSGVVMEWGAMSDGGELLRGGGGGEVAVRVEEGLAYAACLTLCLNIITLRESLI